MDNLVQLISLLQIKPRIMTILNLCGYGQKFCSPYDRDYESNE